MMGSQGDVTPRVAAHGRGDSGVHRLAAGGALSLVGVLVSGAFGFLLTVVITRGLPSVTEAGVFLSAVALFQVVTRLGQLGAATGLIRFFAQRRAIDQHGHLRQLLRVALVPVATLSVALAVAAFVLAEWLGTIFAASGSISSFATYVQVFAPFLPGAILLNLTMGASRGLGTMRPTVLFENVLRPILQVLLVGAALVTDAGALPLAVGYWLPTLLAAILGWRWLLRRLPPRSLEAMATLPWGEFWSFSAPRAVSGVFAVAMQQAGVLFLGALSTSAAAAIYAAATRYLILGTAVQHAVMQAFQPLFSGSLAEEDTDTARDLFQTATAWSSTMTWPIYLTIAVFADTLLLAFGPEYAAGRWAAVVLSLAWLVGTALGPVDSVLVMAGRSSLSMFNLGAAVAVHGVCSLLLIPPYGVLGAALAWMAAILVHNLLPLAQVWVTLRLHPFGRGTLIALVASTLCFGGVGWGARLAFGASLTVAAGSLAISCALYLVVLVKAREALQLTTLVSTVRQRMGSQGAASRTPKSSRS